jgi:myosin heavy subunit
VSLSLATASAHTPSVSLSPLQEYGIIDHLRRRYMRDEIYTNLGEIVISINPFRSLPLYTPDLMRQYLNPRWGLPGTRT